MACAKAWQAFPKSWLFAAFLAAWLHVKIEARGCHRAAPYGAGAMLGAFTLALTLTQAAERGSRWAAAVPTHMQEPADVALAPGSVKARLPSGAVTVRPCWHRSARVGTPPGPCSACSPVVLRVMANVWLLRFVATGHEMVPWPAGRQAALSGL